MKQQIRWKEFDKIHVSDLSTQELIHVHLGMDEFITEDKILISTLTVALGNIRSALINEYSKTLMPLMTMLSILDQLGICYTNSNKPEPTVKNGIKKCLYYFGGFQEDDSTIQALYALRNGLLHNVSLTSYDKKRHYYFVYDENIETVIKDSTEVWDGDYDKLDNSEGQYLTFLSIPNLLKLVEQCVLAASDLNKNGALNLNLPEGKKQLYFNYIRALPRKKQQS